MWAVICVFLHLDPVVLRTEAMSFHGVELPAMAEGQSASDLTPHLWPAACCGCVELGLLHGQLGIVGIDRGLHQSDIGVLAGDMVAVRRQAVEPSDIDLSVLHFAAVEHVQKKRFVARATLDDDDAVPQRASETGQRFAPTLTIADDFGDHGVELGRNLFALGHAGVHPHTRARYHSEAFNHSGSRGKTVVGVFRIQPHLDRVTGGARGLRLQTAASRNVDLKLHEIESGGAFGDRMLDLQAGIHFHEQELVALWFVEKLHGAGIAVAGGPAQTNCGFAQGMHPAQEKARGKALLRGLSDGGAGWCSRAPRPPRSSHSDRR